MQSMPAPPAGGGGQGFFSRCGWLTCKKHQCAKPLAFCWCFGALPICTHKLREAVKTPANVQKQGRALKFVLTVPTAKKPVGTRRAFIHAVFPPFPPFPRKNTMAEGKAVARLRTVPVHESRKCASACASGGPGAIKNWGSPRPKTAASYPLATPGKMVEGGLRKFGTPKPETDRLGRFLCAQVLGGGGTSWRRGGVDAWRACEAGTGRVASGRFLYPRAGECTPNFRKYTPKCTPTYPRIPAHFGARLCTSQSQFP